jgi:hypothetical protein
MKIEIYRTIILPVALYGCESWSLTLRTECEGRIIRSWIFERWDWWAWAGLISLKIETGSGLL